MSVIETFEDLEVWKRGCNLAVDIHVALAESKDFALRNQMERSSLSIPSNIAEGCERDSTRTTSNSSATAKAPAANSAPSSTSPSESASASAPRPSKALAP